jgi:hypothetical protein
MKNNKPSKKKKKTESKEKESQEIQVAPPREPAPLKLTPKVIKEQVDMVQELYETVMKKDKHYGIIPGCGDKPTLLKPGAEMLVLMFQLSPEIKELEKTDLPGGHREYEMTIALKHKHTGEFWGDGTGMCTTMESKYRYRKGNRKCPKCGSETIIKGKAEYGGGWLCWKKKGGCGEKFEANNTSITSQIEGKIENEDLADTYNTVKKMCKKRTLVDAVLSVTAVSNIFTQDIEDENGSKEKNNNKPVTTPPPAPKKEEPKKETEHKKSTEEIKTEKNKATQEIFMLAQAIGCTKREDACELLNVGDLNELKNWTIYELDGKVKKLKELLENEKVKEAGINDPEENPDKTDIPF